MSLTLKIISPTNMPPGQLPEFKFDELGGSIGRKPNNDFVLIDPERFISSQHATVEYQNGHFLITDTSTNGVFINNSKRPVGTGNSQALADGDKISIGEFQLQAFLSESATQENVWDNLDIMSSPPAAGPATSDIFDFSEPLTSGGNANTLDQMDPLALLGGASENFSDGFQSHENKSQSPISSQPADITNNNFFDDILDNPHQNIPEPLPINEPFTPPTAIPDDWDIMGDDLLGASSPAQSTPTSAPAPFPQTSAPLQTTPPFPETQFESTTPLIPDTDSLFEEDDIFASLASTAQPMQSPVATPTAETPSMAAPSIAAALPSKEPYTPVAATPSPVNSAAPTSNNRELLDAFIIGAGLDPARIETDNPKELLTKLGQLTRISTEGLMMALRARATIKSSFRVNKTIIAPVENNPLKFSVTSEDALNVIFADEKTGYMSATEAFSEGFKDLQTHQMAMMAGMQAIIKEITHQFSPDNLERQFDSHKSGSSFMPGNKKAKNWEMYEVFYKKMTDTLQDDFQNIYGEEFARAYENQIQKLM